MMLRRSVSTSLLVFLGASTGCQLVTDFSEERGAGVAGKANAGANGLATGSSKSGVGGTSASKLGSSNAQSTTSMGTAQGGSESPLTIGLTTSGGSNGAIDVTVTGGVVGSGGLSATDVPLSTTAVAKGGNGGITTAVVVIPEGSGGAGGNGTTSAVTPSGGAGTTAVTASGGTTASSTVSACTIGGVAYPADTKKGDNACLNCRPSISDTNWSMAANGTNCGEGMICNAGSCQSGCWIGSSFVAEGTVNPENPCLSCKSSLSATAWSDAPSRYCVQGISAGEGHTCALVDGSIYCWGYNDLGQLGIGTTSTSYVPVRKVFAQYSKAIACGGGTSCAIRDGRIFCWGDNALGQLGYGEKGGASNSYMQVVGLDVGANLVAVGRQSACAIRDASASCWGYNDDGELGDGSSTARPSAGGVRGPLSGVTAISVGINHACAVATGAAKCWGSNAYGKLGVGPNPASLVPVQVTGLTSGVTVISAGDDSTCAVVNGAAQCWGSNYHGMLGSPGTGSSSSVPVQVSGLEKGVTSVSVGGSFACAIVNGGSVCWGGNDYGQLGNDSKTDSNVPVAVKGLSAGVTAIEAGWAHVCAIANGQAYCWGMNNNGRLGIGNGVTESLVPVKLMFDYDNAS